MFWPVPDMHVLEPATQVLFVGIPMQSTFELALPLLEHLGGPTQYPVAQPHCLSDDAVALVTVTVFVPSTPHRRKVEHFLSEVLYSGTLSNTLSHDPEPSSVVTDSNSVLGFHVPPTQSDSVLAVELPMH